MLSVMKAHNLCIMALPIKITCTRLLVENQKHQKQNKTIHIVTTYKMVLLAFQTEVYRCADIVCVSTDSIIGLILVQLPDIYRLTALHYAIMGHMSGTELL